MAGQDDREK